MNGWRTFLRTHSRLGLLLVACALLVKALVPAGYMLGGSSRTLTVQLCSDGLGARMVQTITIPMESGPHDPAGNGKGGGAQADGACAFASLSMAGMAGADPVLLALALAFLLVLGFAPVTVPRAKRSAHLRPPLRGPPATA